MIALVLRFQMVFIKCYYYKDLYHTLSYINLKLEFTLKVFMFLKRKFFFRFSCCFTAFEHLFFHRSLAARYLTLEWTSGHLSRHFCRNDSAVQRELFLLQNCFLKVLFKAYQNEIRI